MPADQLLMPARFFGEAPELPLVESAVRQCCVQQPDRLAAFAACTRIEAFSDGSAPIRNPGGPAGFASVLLGWQDPTAPDAPPDARLDLAGFVPARAEPATSNNRAELAAIMAALSALCALPQVPAHAVIWSDSDYAVQCACRTYQRKKNLDLWAGFDDLFLQAQSRVPDLQFKWMRGHAGNPWNEAADALATRAAFQFDDAAYRRYRSAQQASGREMPPMHLPASPTPAAQVVTRVAAGSSASSWIRGTHYTIVLASRHSNAARDQHDAVTSRGRYQIWTRTGSGVQETVRHEGDQSNATAEYLTLLAALDNLLARIEAKHGDAGVYALTIYSSSALVIKQLEGSYATRATALLPLRSQVGARLARFAAAEFVWKRSSVIAGLLGAVKRWGEP